MSDIANSSERATYMSTFETPLGQLWMAASDDGLQQVQWPKTVESSVVETSNVNEGANHPVLRKTIDQLNEYFAGSRQRFDIPLDPAGTTFQRSVWAVLQTIPYGDTMSYGEQAERLGDKQKARAVGGANGRNPISIIVPCHRVIGSNGALTGFASGVDTKAWLLNHEQKHSGQTLGI